MQLVELGIDVIAENCIIGFLNAGQYALHKWNYRLSTRLISKIRADWVETKNQLKANNMSVVSNIYVQHSITLQSSHYFFPNWIYS